MAFQESGGVKWQISLTLEIMISPYKFMGKLNKNKKQKKDCSVSGQEINFHQS